ncbi:hypothetical protein SUGI_0697680 [Cryptomeria japonica]|nr:hypothetical protein SUGI_0697680 [Cryptomeria japonica]
MPHVKVVDYKPSSQEGVIEVENEVNVSLGLDEESKATIPANSSVSHGHDENSKKVKVFPSPITMGKIVRKVEENSSTAEPLGHSPGVGHNNPPGATALGP